MLTKIKQAFNHRGFKRYFFNTGWLMADKVLRLVVGLFVGVYVARYLGPDKFGILQFAMSFVALFGAFAKLGLDGIVVRNVVHEPDSRDELLGTAFGLRVIGGLVLLAVVFGAVQLTDSGPLTQFIVMIIAAGHVLQAFQVIEFYFQSRVLAKLASIAGVVGLVFSAATRLALIWSGASLIWFAWVVVAENGLKGIILLALYKKLNIPLSHWRFRLYQAKHLLRDSWPLIFSGLFLMIQARIDQVMIKNMLGNTEVGYYAAALRIVEVFGMLYMMIGKSLAPAIAKSKKENEQQYYNRLILFYRFMLASVVLVATFLFFSSNYIVTTLFGTEYILSIGIIKAYSLRPLMGSFGIVRGQFLINQNLTKYSFYSNMVGALINILLNFMLIQTYGIYGAVIATMSSLFFVVFIFDTLFVDTRVNTKLLLNVVGVKSKIV